MPLRPFLAHLEHDPTASRLADEGGSAFVSQSLRPFLIAALADRDVRRPTVVVAGDDRAARDLAADLRAWLRPRPVRFYPSRGVAYESHLTPPPHLVGLRVAALDALLDTPAGAEQPVVVVSAVALSEKVPDPALRPHGFTLRVGELLDLDEAAADLVAAGYERVDQVEDRGQFAVRGGLLDVYPATEERAVRVDLFDDEIESLRWFSTFTQRSLGDADAVEIAPAAELAAEHRELAEIAALENPDERPDVAELLPVGDFRELLDLVPERAQVIVAADEDVEPALRDHWDDVCAAFHDTDAHHLYVKPDGILAALERDASRAAVLDLRLAAARVPRAGGRVRRALAARGRAGAREARALGLHDASSPGRSAAAPSAPPTTSARAKATLRGRQRASSSSRRRCATASSRPQLKLAASPSTG